MASTNAPAKAPPRRRHLTLPEMRTKAAFRAMEKLLEMGVASSEAQLWSVARVMSGPEFEQAAEERSLGGACGSPLCGNGVSSQRIGGGKYHIDSAAQKVYELLEDEGPTFCSPACAGAVKSLAFRLGSESQALHRFERLWEQLQQRRAAAARLAAAAEAGGEKEAAPAAPPAGAEQAPAAAKPKGVLKKKASDYAAGNSKLPIMLSQVKERTPEPPAAAPKPPSARRSQAVEGYVPRPRSSFKAATGAAEGGEGRTRLVRFSDEAQPAGDQAAEASEVDEQPIATTPASGDQPRAGPAPARAAAGGPVIVFDVEDAEGPLEGAQQGLPARFGRLRVADASEVGAPAPPRQPEVEAPGAAAPPAASAAEEVLMQRLRQGTARLFPALAASLPPEIAARLEEEDSASEGASTDTEAERWENLDSSDEEEEGGGGEGGAGGRRSEFQSQLSFFGELFSHLDAWVTEDTLRLLASAPGAPVPPPAPAVPEILTALRRLVGAALPALLARLEAGGARAVVERRVDELLSTLRLAGALPAFRAAQWAVLALALLKALSLERAPELRAAFETREGAARVGKVLAEAAFTVEEFYAVLELICPMDEEVG